MDHRIIRIIEVIQITGLSKSTIRRLEKACRFPGRVPISDRSVGWFERDVLDWLESLRTRRAGLEVRYDQT
jgi:prophage regulatory protein